MTLLFQQNLGTAWGAVITSFIPRLPLMGAGSLVLMAAAPKVIEAAVKASQG